MESKTKNRGFASMDMNRQREIARKGGRAAHEKGKAHEFTPDEARAAGRKGGEKVSVNRRHMAEIGRRGGRSSAQRRRPGAGGGEGGGQQPGGNAGADMHRIEGRTAGLPQAGQGGHGGQGGQGAEGGGGIGIADQSDRQVAQAGVSREMGGGNAGEGQ